MTPVACPRLFEVEALRDGRLVGAELKSFERHLATCGDCAREAALCERLAQALRANALGSADELRVRRERTRLLSAFDRSLTMGHARFGAGHALVALGAVAALLSLWLAFGFGASPSVPEATPSAAASVRSRSGDLPARFVSSAASPARS